jgi:hypothetical protein
MSRQSTITTFRPGDFISERATRGVLNRWRPSTTDEARSSDEARRPARLRRWSVADLIAQAAARPPATRTSS